MKFILHTLLFILSISLNAQTSKRIEILNAEKTFANANKHPDYWRLIGNVLFKHNNAIMQCDSAYHFSAEDKMQAFGKIKITQGDSISLTGKELTYFGSNNKAEIKGNVILVDKYMKLSTQKIYYNLKTNIASYPYYGRIINNEKTINSKKGKYLANIHNFIFTDSVTVISKDYKIFTDNMHYDVNSETSYFFGPSYIISENNEIYCENGWYNTKTDISQFRNNAYINNENYILKGDSLFYNKKTAYGKAMGNVEVIDNKEDITIFGGIAEYFEKNQFIEITKKPLLQIVFEKDTLFMHSKKFLSQEKSGEKEILAFNNVKFFKKDLQGKCDSLSYNLRDSTIIMFHNPILWANKIQITADTLRFLTYSKKIDRIFLENKPLIITKEDSIDYNQIKGKEMTMYFYENKIKKIKVNGNGQSIFLVKDEQKNEKIGVNYSECTNLTLFFKNNQISSINYEVKPNSTTTPYKDIISTEQYLEGFIWREAEQPKKKNDIFIE